MIMWYAWGVNLAKGYVLLAIPLDEISVRTQHQDYD